MTEPSTLCTVTFEPSGAVVCVARGSTVRRAASEADVALDFPCGGLGVCGGCTVAVAGMLEPPEDDECVLIRAQDLAAGVRLACRARVAGDVTVRSTHAAATSKMRVVKAGDLGRIRIEPPERRGIAGDELLLGAAVDIGTTTVVVSIVDLRTGARCGSASAPNPQHAFGHDVLSRIAHVAAYGGDSLRGPIVSTIHELTLRVLSECGSSVDHLREIAIAGNTTMIHLLLRIDPSPLGTAPYGPAFVAPLEQPAADIGLIRLGSARAYVLPGVSAFIGADITAGLLATGLAERDTPSVFVDLGTNGEIVVRTSHGLLAASTAAGPALEGASIESGMRAETGAIERVALVDGELRLETIGGVAPRGLCGSGLLDLIAVLLDTAILDATGRFREGAPHPLASRVTQRDGIRVFEIVAGIYLTQRDVRQVQLANAAIASGIVILLETAGLAADDVCELVIAGGFGYHVQAGALVRMGMIPAAWAPRVSFAGNTALTGATVALLDSGARRRAEAIARHVTTIDLASRPDFQERFVGAMTFPQSEQAVEGE